MTTNRLEAFSDGVIAILITVMVLDFKPPRGPHLADLHALGPTILSYILSFVFLGIYWNNHHHLMHAVRHVTGGVLWANLHLLFWLSLIPFGTNWMGDESFASGPVLLYGVLLLGAAIAYFTLTIVLVKVNGPHSEVAKRLGSDLKAKISLGIYCLGIASATFVPAIACACYVTVALIWLVPDRRFEQKVDEEAATD